MKALLLAALLLARMACAAPVEEIARLPTAGDAVLPVLFSHDDAKEPDVAAVLFNGGGGLIGLQTRGIPRPGANFLVRTRSLFNAGRVATALIDVPGDMGSMSDGYRMSTRHADDVRAVVAELKKRFGASIPVYLVGTSRGTVSAGYTGAALGDTVAGVVLTSSVVVATKGGPGIAGLDLGTIRSRLLLVHHEDDRCIATPFGVARRMAGPRDFIAVQGGEPPKSEPCEPFSAHGYLGVEAPVVQAIVQWLHGGKPPAEVP